MSALVFIAWSIAALTGIALLAAVAGRDIRASAPVYGACLVITLAAALIAVLALAAGPVALHLPLGLPGIGTDLRLDALSAAFLVIVDLGAAAASLYAIGYGAHEPAPGRVLPFYPAFLAAMNLVVIAGDAYSFLFGWEAMSLASWALVMAHHREEANARAGYIYLVMASFGTLALLLGFGLLAQGAGGFDFAAIAAAHPGSGTASVVLLLVLIGAGSKAGLAPLHVWLPLAHPAAPSHVSALMSGVMTKVAIYGFIRIAFDLLGPALWWWSMPVLVVGALTAALGVLHALLVRPKLDASVRRPSTFVFVGIQGGSAFQARFCALATRERAAERAAAAVNRPPYRYLDVGRELLQHSGELDGLGVVSTQVVCREAPELE